jgi:EAL domain-containing protein (putative c-di-GMP-specific phosphodiesterase class I)
MDFIPTAEKSGQINELTRFVVDRAFAYQKRVESQGFPDVDITINFSSKLLVVDDMIAYLKEAVSRHQVNPERIVFEITESMLFENMGLAIVTLTKLRQVGFKIALDDFGTGYSSLTYWKSCLWIS